jgi:hypothetical protein
MLSQNKRGHALRLLVALPLIALLLACLSIPGYADERKQAGNKLFYKGKEFMMSEDKPDTMFVEDVASGQTKMVITNRDPRPITVNGEPIYDGNDVVRGAVYDGKEESASAEFFERIKPILGNLPDGFYRLSIPSVIVGKDGKLIYHSGAEVWPCMNCKPELGEPTTNGAESLMTTKGLKPNIQAAMSEALARGFRFKPAEIKGKPVNAYLEKDLSYPGNIVVVQNGKATMREEPEHISR